MAIEATHKRTVVIAGPGAGKTATLIQRIGRDLETGRIDPRATAVITFTNAAADQLRERLTAEAIQLPHYIGTLHGFTLRHLDRNAGIAVLQPEAADKILEFQIDKHHLKTTAKKVREAITGTGRGRPDSQTQLALKVYRRLLQEENAIDYDLILTDGLATIEARGSWCRHLYVDEYQDSGLIDAAIYEAIQPATAFIVGDTDQSIYAFRGGRPQNLIEATTKPETTTVILEDNYRSLPGICQAANAVIEGNRERIRKQTIPKRSGQALITISEHTTAAEEMTHLLEAIEAKIAAGTNPKHIAVLVRYNAERRKILEQLQIRRIGGAKPPDRFPSDWKMTVSALRAMQSPDNTMLAAEQIATLEHCTWEKAYARAKELHREGKNPMPAALRGIRTAAEAKERLRAMKASQGVLLRIHGLPGATPGELADAMLEEQTQKGDGITVATYHGSKGLEWPIVFLPAAEDSSVRKEEEEARRLFFVAMTRAEDELHISAARNRQPEWGSRSEPTGGLVRFARDIPRRLIAAV